METAEHNPNEVVLEVTTTPQEKMFGVFITADNLNTAKMVDAYSNAIRSVLGEIGLDPRHNTALIEEHQPGRHHWEIPTNQIAGREESEVAEQIQKLFEAIHVQAKQQD